MRPLQKAPDAVFGLQKNITRIAILHEFAPHVGQTPAIDQSEPHRFAPNDALDNIGSTIETNRAGPVRKSSLFDAIPQEAAGF